MNWQTRRSVPFLFLLYAITLFIPLWQLTLFESTEARYAEIAREMLVSGNFLEPTFNGIFHFHKPPLPYWLMASGMAVFGHNDFGVRFFGVVAALVAILFLARSATLVLGDREKGWMTASILATSLLFLAVSRVVSTDIYLTAAVSAAQYFLFRQAYGERSRNNAIFYGLSLGLGFMIKGPVVFLFTLLPHMAARFVDPRQRRIFSRGDILTTAAIFLVTALPWYIAVTVRHPELLVYFTKTQTVERVAVDRFGRNKPWWYFPLLFPLLFLPWSIPFGRLLFSWRSLAPRFRGLLLYVILPLTVFSIAKSKLPPYILPCYGTAAMIAAHGVTERPHPADRWGAMIFMTLAAAAIGVAGFISPPLRPIAIPLLVASLILLALAMWVGKVPSSSLPRGIALFITLLSLVAFLALPWQQAAMKAYRALVAPCTIRDPDKRVPIMVYRAFLPSISFYRGELAVMALGREREVMFETDDRYKQWYLTTDEEVRRFAGSRDRLFVVTEPSDLASLQAIVPAECLEIATRKRYSTYDCRIKPASAPQTGEGVSSVPPDRTRR
ncbi:MAG: glycosyltransferase family 39 protein [Desulfuromonadia bacterium]